MRQTILIGAAMLALQACHQPSLGGYLEHDLTASHSSGLERCATGSAGMPQRAWAAPSMAPSMRTRRSKPRTRMLLGRSVNRTN